MQIALAVEVYLDDVDPAAVCVELYADGQQGGPAIRLEMHRARALIGTTHGDIYGVSVPAARPASDYTARLVNSEDND